MDAISFANNPQHCWMLNVASFSTLCRMFWEVVAQSLKPVKLLACKRTQQFSKVLGMVLANNVASVFTGLRLAKQ